MQDNRNRNLLLTLIAAVVLILCCCCAVIGVGGALLALRAPAAPGAETVKVVTRMVTATPSARRVTPTPPAPAEGTGQPESVPPPLSVEEVGGIPTLDAESAALLANAMPAADARDLALRFDPDGGDIPIVVNATPPSYKVGDKAQFWVSNSDTQKHFQVTAELRYVTDHVAMWVEQGVRMNQRDLEASADRFEQKTYPTNREFFGSEWTPGVDNDVRLNILHARGMGDTVAGYYSSADEYSRQVNEYSNEREMFYVSADSGNAKPNSEFYDGTLAHEFQHMIHWANDRNEDSWVNEGMSELASYLNQFDPGGAEYAYAEQPDTQLTTWADPSIGNAEHYGASYLFMNYFLDRFGEDLTKAVVASAQNGVAGFDEALEKAGRPERFDDIYADWVIANYLDAPDADSEGRYGYSDIDLPEMTIAETHRSFPIEEQAEVSQYGADYIRLEGNGPVTIDFAGQDQVGLVDTTPQGHLLVVVEPRGPERLHADPSVRLARRQVGHPEVFDLVRHRGRLGLRIRGSLHRRRRDLADPAGPAHHRGRSGGQCVRPRLDGPQRVRFRGQDRRQDAEVDRGTGRPDPLRGQGDPGALRDGDRRRGEPARSAHRQHHHPGDRLRGRW